MCINTTIPIGLQNTTCPLLIKWLVLRIDCLGFSLFTRRYSGNHCCFLFLHLLRCFNSVGSLTWLMCSLSRVSTDFIQYLFQFFKFLRDFQISLFSLTFLLFSSKFLFFLTLWPPLFYKGGGSTKHQTCELLLSSFNSSQKLLWKVKSISVALSPKHASTPLRRSKAQIAFKDLMIHGYLRFTLIIALCCVLHRCGSQDIHCWKSCIFS